MNQMLFNDEYHIVQKKTRIAFLELEIKKIKEGPQRHPQLKF